MCLIFRFSSCPVLLLRTYSDHQIVMSSMYKAFKSFCCFFITCGKTCGVPPPSLGAASLCVFLLFLDSTAHDGVPAPGTHGNDSVLHRLYIFKSKQECETRDFTSWYVHVKVHSGTFCDVYIYISDRVSLTWCSSCLRDCAPSLCPAHESSLLASLFPCLFSRPDGNNNPRV